MHTPVLLKPAIENLNVREGGLYIDATYGEGGYTREILKMGGKVLALDLDPRQVETSALNDKKLTIINGNFANIEKIAKENDFFPVDGVVFDLGLSMGQLEFGGRGLSYNKPDEEIDMRIGLDAEMKASELILNMKEDELYEVLARGSEEIKSKDIARVIKSGKKIRTVAELIKAIDRAVGFKSRTVYARIFQALRIEVNHEFDNLKKGLVGAAGLIKKDGRIVVVSFHSLEDRIVKSFGKTHGFKFKNDPSKNVHDRQKFERSAKIRTLYYEQSI
jgi:16S rRNA (cytosine1402-N4)-methyltransferase